ncbi:hypothetical protein NR798_32780 [Archangium gephyra]|uniref:hypothetical protein n=1 Tax=Archangium gephyra TaxID=48 RepID=UPI0035D46A00
MVRVLGHGRQPSPDDGYLYLVMEYVQGQPLLRHADESLEDSANLLAPDVIAGEIVDDLCAALEQFEARD